MTKLLQFALSIALGLAIGTGIDQAYSAVTTTSAANPLNNIVGGSINNTPIGATTPSTGAFTTLTATTVNGHTFTAGSSTFTGTAAQTYTFPTTSATIARTDAAQTFTGHNTFEGVTPTGATGTGNMVFSASPTFTGTITAATVNGTAINSTGDYTANSIIASSSGGQLIKLKNTHASGLSSIRLEDSAGTFKGDMGYDNTAARIRIGGNTGVLAAFETSGVLVSQFLRTTQAAVPTCTSNCGTSPSVAGSDTAGIVTMGGTGVPASAWVVTFNGTWSAAPSCIVQSALATMVVGKMPIAVVTTTTTMTVTTNGTAPANSDKYQYHCIGVS